MDKKTRRMNNIRNILDEKGYISVKELSKILQVSEMTVRRDTNDLVKSGMVDLVNGVIIKNAHSDEEKYDIGVASKRQWIQKEMIGRFAVTLIQDGDVIALDVGTTTEQIAKHLPKGMDLTIICYSYNILSEVRNKGYSKIVFGGGFFREKSQTFESQEGIQLIKKYRINKAFLSAAGVSNQLGITCANGYEVPLKRAVIESSQEKILVFDSSKINKVKATYFGDIGEFDAIITDENLSGETEEYFSDISCTNMKRHIV